MVRVRTVLDTLACLAALLGTAPLIVHIDRIPQVVFPLALLIALLVTLKRVRPLRGAIPTVLSGSFFIFYALQFSGDTLARPAADILVILLSVRLASEKEPRHHFQISALALFCLAASSLFSLSAAFAVYLVLMLLCLSVSLVLLAFLTVDGEASLTPGGLRRVATTAMVLPLSALPLILVFFLVMPRPQYPLWDLGTPGRESTAGFSDRVDPGASASVREMSTPVLRAEGERIAAENLYWRGIVLNTPTKKGWVRRGKPERDRVNAGAVRPVRQTVFPEPSTGKYLIALDIPVTISGFRVRQAPDLVFTFARTRRGRLRYDTFSVPGGTVTAPEGIDRKFYLQLPDGFSPRIRSLGESIGRKGHNDRERLALLSRYFKSSAYRYSTRNLPTSGHPLEQFLFGRRAGNCEFFASSFALLLRVAGVPSRLVAGYYGGDYNRLGGYYLVTSDMAHVWVEAYLEGTGWVRRDPTSFAVGFVVGGRAGRGALMDRLRMLSDTLNYYWNLMVITYDLDKQIRLFRKAQGTFQSLSVPHLKRAFILLVAVAGFVLLCFFLSRYKRVSRRERLLKRFIRHVEKKFPGEPMPPATGLFELARRTDDPLVRRFVEIYAGALYRDRDLTADEMSHLRGLLKRIRRGAKPDCEMAQDGFTTSE